VAKYSPKAETPYNIKHRYASPKEERAWFHPGRGKYKRNTNQYFIDAYDRRDKGKKNKEKLYSGIAFGRKDLRRERGVAYSQVTKQQHKSYYLEIYNNTQGHYVKP